MPANVVTTVGSYSQYEDIPGEKNKAIVLVDIGSHKTVY
jgi:hypothetical protein